MRSTDRVWSRPVRRRACCALELIQSNVTSSHDPFRHDERPESPAPGGLFMSRIKGVFGKRARIAVHGSGTARCIAGSGEGSVSGGPWLRRLGLWRLRIPRLRFWRLRYVALCVRIRLWVWIPRLWNDVRRNGLRRNGLRRNGLRLSRVWRFLSRRTATGTAMDTLTRTLRPPTFWATRRGCRMPAPR